MIKQMSNIDYKKGDTIVEVLNALAIASFAIGISYATANKSLQRTITAREHGEALSLAQNQLTDLKFRYQKTPPNSLSQFAYPTANNFCLDDAASDPSAANWGPKPGPCAQGIYSVLITTKNSTATVNPTIYTITVTWPPISGTQVNHTSINYRF